MESDYIPCPFCAEPIRGTAIKCRHCGSDVREEAVARFVGESQSAEAITPPDEFTSSACSAVAIGRLRLGILGHYLFIPACFVLFAGAAEVGSGLKAVGAIVLAGAYAMIGLGWLGMRIERSSQHGLCTAACFLAVVGLLAFASSDAPVGTREKGLNQSLQFVFASHAFYMLAVALWYHTGGVKRVIGFRGLTETTSLVSTNNIVYTGFTYLVFVSILIASFAAKSNAGQVAKVLALVGGVICMFRPINHFKGMKRDLEKLTSPSPE